VKDKDEPDESMFRRLALERARRAQPRPRSCPDPVDADLEAVVDVMPLSPERARFSAALAATRSDLVLYRATNGLPGDDTTALLAMTGH